MDLLPLLFALVVGFSHSFEADHLVAVSSIVTRRTNTRNNVLLCVKDGIFWGLGHTSTILLVGILFVIGKQHINESVFSLLEAAVGLMLILLGITRLLKARKEQSGAHYGHSSPAGEAPHTHSLAYGVGLVHGLAGSGALMLSVLATIKDTKSVIAYLLLFGAGSIAGMMLAAGVFSIPFSNAILRSEKIRKGLTLLSSLLCIILGSYVLYENLTGA